VIDVADGVDLLDFSNVGGVAAITDLTIADVDSSDFLFGV